MKDRSKENAEEIALAEAGRSLMLQLCEAFPAFLPQWQVHLADWNGEAARPYNDIAVFAHFFVEELFERAQVEEAKRALGLIEQLFLSGNEATRDLLGIGFIEDVGNITSGRKDGHARMFPLLPPTLLRVWQEIDRQWAGCTSLADVLEAELNHPGPPRTWAELLKL